MRAVGQPPRQMVPAIMQMSTIFAAIVRVEHKLPDEIETGGVDTAFYNPFAERNHWLYVGAFDTLQQGRGSWSRTPGQLLALSNRRQLAGRIGRLQSTMFATTCRLNYKDEIQSSNTV